MALERADRVGEQCSSGGTGTLNLSGNAASGGFRTFAGAGINNLATVELLLIDPDDATIWEVTESVFTNAAPDTLSRGTLLSSSTGSRINFATPPTAYITQPAARLYTNNPNVEIAGSNNEAFGQGTSVGMGGSAGQTVFGRAATSSQSGGTAIGSSATAGHGNVVAVGSSSLANQTGAVAIGSSAQATAAFNVAIGNAALAQGNPSIAIGGTTVCAHASIGIGRDADSTAAGQFIVGGAGLLITDVYIGRGVTHSAPQAVTYHGQDASGTDVAGGDLVLAAGRGTGSGAGGKFTVRVAPAGGSGSTLNTLVDVGQFDADTTSGNTRFLLYDVATGLQRVKVGANGSGPGGVGRALYLDDV